MTLLSVQQVVSAATASGNMVLAVSLDIVNAFNSIPYSVIRRALFRKKIPDYLRRIVISYLTNRRIRFKDCNRK